MEPRIIDTAGTAASSSTLIGARPSPVRPQFASTAPLFLSFELHPTKAGMVALDFNTLPGQPLLWSLAAKLTRDVRLRDSGAAVGSAIQKRSCRLVGQPGLLVCSYPWVLYPALDEIRGWSTLLAETHGHGKPHEVRVGEVKENLMHSSIERKVRIERIGTRSTQDRAYPSNMYMYLSSPAGLALGSNGGAAPAPVLVDFLFRALGALPDSYAPLAQDVLNREVRANLGIACGASYRCVRGICSKVDLGAAANLNPNQGRVIKMQAGFSSGGRGVALLDSSLDEAQAVAEFSALHAAGRDCFVSVMPHFRFPTEELLYYRGQAHQWHLRSLGVPGCETLEGCALKMSPWAEGLSNTSKGGEILFAVRDEGRLRIFLVSFKREFCPTDSSLNCAHAAVSHSCRIEEASVAEFTRMNATSAEQFFHQQIDRAMQLARAENAIRDGLWQRYFANQSVWNVYEAMRDAGLPGTVKAALGGLGVRRTHPRSMEEEILQ